MSRFVKKQQRKVELRRKPLQRVRVQVINKKPFSELIISILGSISTLLLAGVAIYAAFFSPLSDAVQAQYKYKDITNTEEIGALSQNLSQKENELKLVSEKLKKSQNELSIEQSSLLAIKQEIKSTSNKLRINEKELRTSRITINETRAEYDNLNTLLATKQEQYRALEELHTSLIVKAAKTKLDEVISKGHFFLSINMLRKYNGADKYMRDAPTLDVTKISSFNGYYLWETAQKNLAMANVSSIDRETYGPNYELVYNRLKTAFTKTCKASFLSLRYIDIPEEPVYITMDSTYSSSKNLEISLANREARRAYMDKLSSELTDYQQRVRHLSTKCINNLKV